MAKSSVKETVDQEQNEQKSSAETEMVTMSMMDILAMVNQMVDERLKAKESEASENDAAGEKTGTDEDVKKVNDYMKENVEVELFADNDKYKDDVIVAVNGKTWQIKRGVPVQVPRYVAEVIKNSQNQDRATAIKIREMEQESVEKLKNM